ncbi:anti-sigma factor antagonist [Robertmurraya yapensis]|uniref:Anti-sigma factor antagonist n=1 Tax=Bacillus yapensis TaxID=2492960 RepID=A0A431WL67_9BACI|nr:STAS domain-containing protein [Bacillus yapensis]RTR36166.1 anti-sigma factor antagonist [Bacillus yapensis]TKT05669.1 STAS domain-containing protein [Bacillus yapensis]
MFSYNLKHDNLYATIQFHGDLDIEVTEMMEYEIIPALQQFSHIEIDLQEVPFVDSTGIGLLLNLIQTFKKGEDGVQVTITNIQPLVKEVFEMLQLADILGDEVLSFHS